LLAPVLSLPASSTATCLRFVELISGRHKAFSSLGLSVSSFQEAGTLMALSELALQYKAPLRAGDLFYITTAVAQVRG
jgi:acyl-CoA thioesterase FadM